MMGAFIADRRESEMYLGRLGRGEVHETHDSPVARHRIAWLSCGQKACA